MRSIVILTVAASLIAGAAHAQIVTDGSLGARTDLGGEVAIIRGELGRRSGENLFHSFETFSVESGDRATFGLPDGVGRVISRVTGGEASTLNGLISFADDATVTLPASADFWFFNPNGVMVGQGAEFRTSGALYFSGGDSVIFADGTTFSADTSQPLTISSARPEAFGFLNAAPGPVIITGAQLPAQGDGITLAGGQVVIDGANLTADRADERLTLIAGGQGDIAPVQPGERLVLTSGRILISDGVAANGVRTGVLETREGGDISLYAGNIEVDGGQVLTRSNRADGGAIDVRADRLVLRNGGVIGTLTEGAIPVGADDANRPDAGAIQVTARDITLTRGSVIRSQTLGDGDPDTKDGDAGQITVDGFDRLLITRDGGDAETSIESEVAFGAKGAAGDAGLVLVRGGDLRLIDGGSIFSSTFGDGDAGAVEVDVATITATDGGQIGSGARDNTALLVASDPDADLRATGAGGSVTVRASESMSFSGKLRPRPNEPGAELESAGILTATEGERTGRGGDLFASAPLIILTNEAEIGAETFFASNAGDLTLEGGMLIVSGGSEVSTTSRGAGRAGNVTLRFSDAVDLPGDGSIASSAQQVGLGAGNVSITTGRLTVGPGSRLTTDSLAVDGGNISVSASRFAFINDGVVTTSVAESVGTGGTIDFSGGPLALGGVGRVESTADAGDGGTVTISSAISFIETPGATIDVSSVGGQDGSIEFLGAIGDQTAETEAPPAEFFNRFALIDDFCVAAVTGGSALRLVAPNAPPLSADMAPALFGGAIPYPTAEGRADALTLTLASADDGCEAVQ